MLNLPVVWAEECLAHVPGAEIWVGVTDSRDGGAGARHRASGRGGRRRRPARAGDRVRGRGARVGARPGVPGPSGRGLRGLGGGWVPDRSRSGPGRAVRLSDLRDAGRPAGAGADRDPRPGRTLLLRHDDARGLGHVDRGPGGDRRGPDGGGSRRRGRARGVRHLPPTRTSRDPVGLWRIVLPQQRGGGGRGAAPVGSGPGRGRRHRRPPRKRHAGGVLRPG